MIPIVRVKIETDIVYPLLFAKNIENLNVQEFWKYMELFSEITTGYKSGVDNYLESYYEDENSDFSEELYEKFLENIKDPEFRGHLYEGFIEYIKDLDYVFYATIKDFNEQFYILMGQNREEESTYSERKNYLPEYLKIIHNTSIKVFKENNIRNIKIKFKEYHDHIEFTFYATKSISEEAFYELIDGEIIHTIFQDENIDEKFFVSFDRLENVLFGEEFNMPNFEDKIMVFREGSNHIKVIPLLSFNEEFETEFENYEMFQEKAKKILGQKMKKIMDVKESKNVILTDDKLKMLIESTVGSLFKESENEAGLNFYKAYYNPTTKKISAAYYLVEETEQYYKILNVQEIREQNQYRKDKIFFQIPYVYYFDLPKEKAIKLDITPTQPNFYYFEMSYRYYKQTPELQVKRIMAPAEIKSLTGGTGRNYKNIVSMQNDKILLNYLISAGFMSEDFEKLLKYFNLEI